MIDRGLIKALSVALFITTWTSYAVTGNATLFFHLFALSNFTLAFSLTLTVKYRYLDTCCNIIMVWLTFSNIIDEFWGDPTRFQWNEYLFAIIAIIFSVRARKNKTTSEGSGWTKFRPNEPEKLVKIHKGDDNNISDGSLEGNS
jgi:hypothetical protein